MKREAGTGNLLQAMRMKLLHVLSNRPFFCRGLEGGGVKVAIRLQLTSGDQPSPPDTSLVTRAEPDNADRWWRALSSQGCSTGSEKPIMSQGNLH